ncbi:hypothetical protein Tco_0706994 [Tanacetum coccineum]|uniref:Uncharacterized protein n=1 Tax=Tanacetum coccineum TaxID=301880 RepID=A0ABQ4YAJ3_9ASTR
MACYLSSPSASWTELVPLQTLNDPRLGLGPRLRLTLRFHFDSSSSAGVIDFTPDVILDQKKAKTEGTSETQQETPGTPPPSPTAKDRVWKTDRWRRSKRNGL